MLSSSIKYLAIFYVSILENRISPKGYEFLTDLSVFVFLTMALLFCYKEVMILAITEIFFEKCQSNIYICIDALFLFIFIAIAIYTVFLVISAFSFWIYNLCKNTHSFSYTMTTIQLRAEIHEHKKLMTFPSKNVVSFMDFLTNINRPCVKPLEWKKIQWQ